MKLRWLASVFIFLSAYSPLAVIFAIQDLDFNTWSLKHPEVIYPLVVFSIISCIIVWVAVHFIKSSSPTVTIKKVSNRSGELVNYSIPYLVSFFVMDLDDLNMMASFVFFMIIMYWMTLKTHNIFVNPILACLGYNLYDVKYEKAGEECEDFFLVKGARIKPTDRVRITCLSEQLFLVSEVNPDI